METEDKLDSEYTVEKYTFKFKLPLKEYDLFEAIRSYLPEDVKREDVSISKEDIFIKEIRYVKEEDFCAIVKAPISEFKWEVCELDNNVLSLTPVWFGDHSIGTNIDAIKCSLIFRIKVHQSETDDQDICDDKKRKEDSGMGRFTIERPDGSEIKFNIGLDMKGNLAISTAESDYNGNYKRYDAKSNKIINVEGFVFEYNDFCKVFSTQVKDLVAGDIICGEKSVIAVKKINENGTITGISFDENTEVTVIPESILDTNLCIIDKIVNLMNPGKIDNMTMMLNIGEERDVMNKKGMLMMMAMQNQNGEVSNNKMLPLLMMGDMKDNKALMLMMMMSQQNNDGKEGGNANNLMLPLLLMSGEDGCNTSDDKALMLMMMMSQQNNDGGSTNNMMLPLLLMNGKSGDDTLKTVMAVNMMGQMNPQNVDKEK